MGGASSSQQQQDLMRQNAEMARRLAQEKEKNRKQHEAHLQQMAKMMALVAATTDAKPTQQKDRKTVQIENVQYELHDELSRGGFGVVYKAQAKNNNRWVAIKFMKNSPSLQREIENEIRFLRLTKKLKLEPHPVIDFCGAEITTDLIMISLELAQCDVLTFWFETLNGRSAEDKFLFGTIIIMYTLRALTFLERLNIIHGDIKPQNLVLVSRGETFCIKLIDFGTVEKMQTARPIMTVDASKAYTNFFVSPEFIKRDSRNLVSRRLHKKSDAWAAGVMFYLLFMRDLPWKDEHDYHNFVNDPDARDIVVPDIGGYKAIIELLLKKNPDKRASAKDTLLQLKNHPDFGALVAQLEKTFYPVDDVCKIRIPDDFREQIGLNLSNT